VRRAAALLAGLAIGVAANAQADGWTRTAELALGYDDNAGNAGSRDDVQGSGFVALGTRATWERRFGKYTALQLQPGLAFEQWLRLDELTSTRFTARARVLHKPGRGFHTPVLAGSVATGAREAASEIRDGFDYRAGVSAAAPLTTAVQARIEVSRSRRVATSGRAFDLDSRSYGASLDWQAAPRLAVYAGLRQDDGDFTVTANGNGAISPKTEHLYLEARAGAVEPDPAFGADWWAFRVDGRTRVATLGANMPLSSTLALDLQWQRGEARMGRFTYVRDVASLGVLARW
jgi:hypothetical protein